MNVADTLRKATAADFPAIFQLLEQADLATNRQLLKTRNSHSHLLVLDALDGSGLAATAMLFVKEGKGSLSVLAIAPRFRDLDLEQLLGSSEELCTALQATELEVYSAAHV